jgi:hypothetical protein
MWGNTKKKDHSPGWDGHKAKSYLENPVQKGLVEWRGSSGRVLAYRTLGPESPQPGRKKGAKEGGR